MQNLVQNIETWFKNIVMKVLAGNGVYKIDLDGNGSEQPFEVYCDMTSDGGGWTYVTYKYEIVDNNPTSVNAHTKYKLLFKYRIN